MTGLVREAKDTTPHPREMAAKGNPLYRHSHKIGNFSPAEEE
jgi:hypothetical protein